MRLVLNNEKADVFNSDRIIQVEIMMAPELDEFF